MLKAYQKDLMSVDSAYIEIPEPPRRRAVIETSFRNITVELSSGPLSTEIISIKLAEEHFTDSLLFHRVMSGFMIQGRGSQFKNAKAGQMLRAGRTKVHHSGRGSLPDLIHQGRPCGRKDWAIRPARKKPPPGRSSHRVQEHAINADVIGQIEQVRKFQLSPDRKSGLPQSRFRHAYPRPKEYGVRLWMEGLEVIDQIAAQKPPQYQPA
ncbi:MAG: peptidylprolyl isomerase [Saprospirales bacterium]|nr:peptidylprolyl isomerase [Saprospirales bacterium]